MIGRDCDERLGVWAMLMKVGEPSGPILHATVKTSWPDIIPGHGSGNGGRWDLRQGPSSSRPSAGDDGGQPAAKDAACDGPGRGGRGGVVGPESTAGPHRVGKRSGSVAVGQPGARPLRQAGEQAVARRPRRRGDRLEGRSGALVDEPSGWWPSFASTCRRTWPRFSRRSPISSRWRPRSPIASRSSEPASSSAVRVGKYRCIQRVLVDLHVDQGLGPGAEGWTSGMIAPNSAGLMIRTAARATRTSVGRVDGRCWRRKFVRFNAPE